MVDANEESEEEGADEYGEQELKEAEKLDVPVVIAKVRLYVYIYVYIYIYVYRTYIHFIYIDEFYFCAYIK